MTSRENRAGTVSLSAHGRGSCSRQRYKGSLARAKGEQGLLILHPQKGPQNGPGLVGLQSAGLSLLGVGQHLR